MSDDVLRLERRGAVAILTLDRPKAANGIDLALGKALMMQAIALSEDAEVRAVVLTGAGRFFCAGGDLKSFAGFGPELPARLKELTAYLHTAITRFSRMDAPLIVAVNGMAAGAGMSLAITGDLVVAAESAGFTMAYTAAGLSPDGSSSWFLPRLVGDRRARELMLTNRRLTAAEALDWGLINEVVADGEALDAAVAQAETLAEGATGSYGAVKDMLLATFGNGLETQMELETRHIAARAASEDGREGIAAFSEGRKPVFKGTR